MDIYLPIAELSQNVFVLFAMGAAVGFISGLFGVGGGFLLTPLLIFSGIPSAVAVATAASHIIASSTSGMLSYWRRRLIDVKLAGVLLIGGVSGSSLGVWLFDLLEGAGQLDLVVSFGYLFFLGSIGSLMLIESVKAMLATRRGKPVPTRRPGQHTWVHGLPLKMRFKRSKLYVSAIPVLGLGLGIGVLGTLLGIGGGFILVPAMIYLLRVPTSIVVGTSLLQIVFTMATASVLHAVSNQSVDVVLALTLMVGGVIGAQFGAQFGLKLRGEQLRALLGLLVLAVAVRFAFQLVVPPPDVYSLTRIAGAGP